MSFWAPFGIKKQENAAMFQAVFFDMVSAAAFHAPGPPF